MLSMEDPVPGPSSQSKPRPVPGSSTESTDVGVFFLFEVLKKFILCSDKIISLKHHKIIIYAKLFNGTIFNILKARTLKKTIVHYDTV